MRRELIALSVAEYGLRAAEASFLDALELKSRRALSIMMREGFDMKTHLIAAAALPASSPQAQCGRHIAVEIALAHLVTIMRFVIALMTFLATVAPARTQPWAPEFVQSEQAFNSLPVDTRITFQVLLTAAGYWPAVPNVTYSGRLNGAVRRFQIDHGFRPTGMLNAAELDKLIDVAAPMLNMWEFQSVGHPDHGRPIWVPFGLGLQVERVDGGIRWRDVYRRVSLLYTYKPNRTVESAYQSALSAFIRSGAAIEFKVARRDFYAISADGADGIDSYTRYHQDGTGVLGFLLTWRRDAVDLHIERVATLISGSLWSSMTGAAFIDPPKPSPGRMQRLPARCSRYRCLGFRSRHPKKKKLPLAPGSL